MLVTVKNMRSGQARRGSLEERENWRVAWREEREEKGEGWEIKVEGREDMVEGSRQAEGDGREHKMEEREER